MFIITAAHAITCDTGDTTCELANDLRDEINTAFTSTLIADTGVPTGRRTTRLLSGLRGMETFIENAGCTIEASMAGAYDVGAETVTGGPSSGVNGSLIGGGGPVTLSGNGSSYGDGFGAYQGRTKRALLDRDDGGFLIVKFVRLGSRGGWYGFEGTCPDAAADLDSWIPGDKSGWSTETPPTIFIPSPPSDQLPLVVLVAPDAIVLQNLQFGAYTRADGTTGTPTAGDTYVFCNLGNAQDFVAPLPDATYLAPFPMSFGVFNPGSEGVLVAGPQVVLDGAIPVLDVHADVLAIQAGIPITTLHQFIDFQLPPEVDAQLAQCPFPPP